jgi:hypothetical protein
MIVALVITVARIIIKIAHLKKTLKLIIVAHIGKRRLQNE